MKSCRSLIIWIPYEGSGKIHKLLVRPSLIRLLSLVVLLCICAVPFLEIGLLTFMNRISDLEKRRDKLESEVTSLHYLKRELGRIEAKEEKLRDHFGMGNYRVLNPVKGDVGETSPVIDKDGSAGSVIGDASIDSQSDSGTSLQRKMQILRSNYEILQTLLKKQDKIWDETPSIIPVDLEKPKISSEFGWRVNPFTKSRELHAGIDIIGRRGVKIIAPANGEVVRKGYSKWLGNYLVVEHNNHIKTIYGHLDSVFVERGARVKRRALLGFMGNTGLSTSSHLHYSVLVRGRPVNPMLYILDFEG